MKGMPRLTVRGAADVLSVKARRQSICGQATGQGWKSSSGLRSADVAIGQDLARETESYGPGSPDDCGCGVLPR